MPTDTEMVRVLPGRWRKLVGAPDAKQKHAADLLLFWSKDGTSIAEQTHVHVFHNNAAEGWMYNIKCADEGSKRLKHRVNPAWSVDQLVTQMMMDWFYECREYFVWLGISDIKLKRILQENGLPLAYMYYNPVRGGCAPLSNPRQ
jgi:hypothetical protein